MAEGHAMARSSRWPASRQDEQRFDCSSSQLYWAADLAAEVNWYFNMVRQENLLVPDHEITNTPERNLCCTEGIELFEAQETR